MTPTTRTPSRPPSTQLRPSRGALCVSSPERTTWGFDYAAMVAEADVIVDTRNAIKEPHPNVFRLGAPRPEAAGQTITA